MKPMLFVDPIAREVNAKWFIYSYSQWNLQPLGFHHSIYSSSYLKRRFELLAISEHQNIIRLNYPRTTIKETNNWL